MKYDIITVTYNSSRWLEKYFRAFEKLDYKAIRAEASELWTVLVERDPDNAPIILKKVEMIFGRPMKLSEITEDQVDLFNLVLLDMRDMVNE